MKYNNGILFAFTMDIPITKLWNVIIPSRMRKIVSIFIAFILFSEIQAQGFDTYVSVDYSSEKSYSQQLIVYWENDIFLRTDYYFTNGAAFELLSTQIRWKPLEKFLSTPFTLKNKTYSLTVRQNMYTPIKMYSGEVEYDDRPYAGYLLGEYKILSESRHRRFISSLTIGILGENSLAGKTQDFVHGMEHLQVAQGWQYQLKNAPVINVNYRHDQFIIQSRYVDLQYGLIGRLGTLYTDAQITSTIRFGNLTGGFDHLAPLYKTNKWESYLYANAGAKLSYHDATLQGSIIQNEPNVYYIANSNRHAFVYNVGFGIVASYRFVRINAYINRHTPEFRGGVSHGWGGVSLSLAF